MLPLVRNGRQRWLDTTCLVTGAISPDFEYFLHARLESNLSHTLMGLFLFDVPVALGIAVVFHAIVRDPLALALPSSLRSRFADFLSRNWCPRLHVAVASALVGAVTHVAWDACTHRTGYVVRMFPWLEQRVLVDGFPLYRLLQHASSAIGLLVIVVVVARLPRRSHVEVSVSSRFARVAFVACPLVMGVCVAAARVLYEPAVRVYGHAIVALISGALLGICVASLGVKRGARIGRSCSAVGDRTGRVNRENKLVLLTDGAARQVEASALPELIADASVGNDGAALAMLVEVAIDVGSADALRATAPALARLRMLRAAGRGRMDPEIDVDALSAQVGIALVALRDVDPRTSLVGVPLRVPLWSTVIAGASSLVPDPATNVAPRVVLFAFSDESNSAPAASAGPQTASGLLTRALPLAIAERLLPYADTVVTTPVVEGRGIYVAKSAWALPEVLALSPLAELAPTHIVTGRISSAEPLSVEIDVWDLAAGSRVARAAEHGNDGEEHDVIVALTLAVADALAGRKRAKKQRLPPRATRALRDDVMPARESRAHLDALAHVHAMFLAAVGAFDARALANADVALDALRVLARADASLRARLGFVAFVVTAVAAGLDVGAEAKAEARALTTRVASAPTARSR